MNLKFLSIAILSCGLFIGCAENKSTTDTKTTSSSTAAPQTTTLSEYERRGLAEIEKYYNGQTKHRIGELEDGSGQYFEVELFGSAMMEEFARANLIGMPSSNLTYIMFKNFAAERTKYKEVRSVITLQGNQKVKVKFSTDQLRLIEDRLPMVIKIVESMGKNEVDLIGMMMEPSNLVKFNKDNFMNNLKLSNEKYGAILGYLTYGFEFRQVPTGEQIIHISGKVQRSIQSHEFSVDFDAAQPPGRIIMIDYKF